MKILDITLKTKNGSTSLGFSQFMVEYISKTEKWGYVFDCIINGEKIDMSNWDY
jgi:hypothetical protein